MIYLLLLCNVLDVDPAHVGYPNLIHIYCDVDDIEYYGFMLTDRMPEHYG